MPSYQEAVMFWNCYFRWRSLFNKKKKSLVFGSPIDVICMYDTINKHTEECMDSWLCIKLAFVRVAAFSRCVTVARIVYLVISDASLFRQVRGVSHAVKALQQCPTCRDCLKWRKKILNSANGSPVTFTIFFAWQNISLSKTVKAQLSRNWSYFGSYLKC